MKRTRLLVVLCAIALVFAQSTRTPLAQNGQDDRSDVQLGTEEVLIDFTAVDGKKRPVLDLKPEDIEVYEDGKRQEISSFRLVRVGPTPEGVAEDVPATGAFPAELEDSPFRDFNLILIVIDRSSIDRAYLPPIYAAAEDFVTKDITPNDLVAVFTVGRELRLLQNFTNDRDRLIAALKQATSGVEGPSTPTLTAEGNARNTYIVPTPATPTTRQTDELGTVTSANDFTVVANELNQLAATTEAQTAYIAEQIQARAFVQALFTLVKSYSRISDRKSIVLYSQGLAVDSPVATSFDALISSANRHNFTFYAVDAAGLRTTERPLNEPLSPAQIGATTDVGRDRSIVTGGNSSLGHAERRLRTDSNAALHRISEETGGIMIKNTNDLKRGFESLSNDLRSYYVLSYVPKDLSTNGSYRSVEVKVVRKGVDVRSRNGYFAVPVAEGDILLPFERDVFTALGTKLDRKAKDLTAAVSAETFASDGRWVVPILFSMSGKGLEPAKADDKNAPLQFMVDIVALVKDRTGRVVAKRSRQTGFGVPKDRLDYFRSNYLPLPLFPEPLYLDPGSYTLTVGFYDPNSKRALVVEEPLTVPELATAKISSLVVGYGAEKVENPVAFERDPFRVNDELRVVASPIKRLSKQGGDRLIVYFRMVGTPGAQYRMQMEYLRDGEAPMQSDPMPLPTDASTGEVVVARDVKLEEFSSGKYTAQLTVYEPNSETVAGIRRTPFEVVP